MLNVNVDGVWQQRCYSISSAADDSATLTLTIQAQADSLVSRHVHALKTGEVVHLSEPMGEFVAPQALKSNLLFITGGSGITPIMSMLRSGLLDELFKQKRTITHIHYAPDAERTIFAAELESLASEHDHYDLHIEHTQSGGTHYSQTQLENTCPDWRERQTFLCGPTGLMQAVHTDWHAADLDHLLTQESFSPLGLSVAADSDADNVDAGDLHFCASGKVSPAAERDAESDATATLLTQAEAAGLKPKFGCRVGICHSCDCHLVSGAVRNLRTGKISQTSADRGPIFIQPCISAAIGDVEVEL